MNYTRARQTLQQAYDEVARLEAEFARCRFSDDELHSPDVRQMVLAAYDELSQRALKTYQLSKHVNLRKVYEQVFADWLKFSSEHFAESCVVLYLSSLIATANQPNVAAITARAIFKEKDERYGSIFLKLGVPGIRTRLGDKIARYKTLSASKVDGLDESIADTLLDAANYALMAAICHRFSKAALLPVP